MTPPEVPAASIEAAGETPPAVSVCVPVTTLTKRPDFLRAARASHAATKGMVVQARNRKPGEAAGIRVGFTCSKKVGNAVTRNRAKRRLRAVAHEILPQLGQDGWDYVLIGRASVTVSRGYGDLLADLTGALRKLHGLAE